MSKFCNAEFNTLMITRKSKAIDRCNIYQIINLCPFFQDMLFSYMYVRSVIYIDIVHQWFLDRAYL